MLQISFSLSFKSYSIPLQLSHSNLSLYPYNYPTPINNVNFFYFFSHSNFVYRNFYPKFSKPRNIVGTLTQKFSKPRSRTRSLTFRHKIGLKLLPTSSLSNKTTSKSYFQVSCFDKQTIWDFFEWILQSYFFECLEQKYSNFFLNFFSNLIKLFF